MRASESDCDRLRAHEGEVQARCKGFLRASFRGFLPIVQRTLGQGTGPLRRYARRYWRNGCRQLDLVLRIMQQ